jgi:hypothetical protein
MTQSERERALIEHAERTHKAVMEAMTKEKLGREQYTWRDRYLRLFETLWDRQERARE